MIFAIKPFEIHDGDGIRTTVFLKGCPLRCQWCHNPESLSPKKEMLYDAALCAHCGRCASLCSANVMENGKHIFYRDKCSLCGRCESLCPRDAFEIAGREMSAREIAEEVLRDEIFMKDSGGGVTFSGGEPLLQADLCVEIARLLKEKGIHIAVDTSGYAPRAELDKLLPYTDLFLFDIKAVDETVHKTCTGVSNRMILDNIRYADSMGVPMEIRYPYVPGMNDGEAEKIADFVKTLSHVRLVRVLGYHNFAERKYACLGRDYPMPETPVPTKEEVEAAAERMRKRGLASVTAG